MSMVQTFRGADGDGARCIPGQQVRRMKKVMGDRIAGNWTAECFDYHVHSNWSLRAYRNGAVASFG
jgi:hypothetical protein